MELKYVGVACVISAAISAGLVYKYARISQIETVVKDNVVTVVHEVVKPDGTIFKNSTTTDRSVKTSDATIMMPAAKPNWFVQVDYNSKMEYGILVSKQVFMDMYVGVQANQNGTLGAAIGITF